MDCLDEVPLFLTNVFRYLARNVQIQGNHYTVFIFFEHSSQVMSLEDELYDEHNFSYAIRNLVEMQFDCLTSYPEKYLRSAHAHLVVMIKTAL